MNKVFTTSARNMSQKSEWGWTVPGLFECLDPYLLKYRFVVVDIIDPNDDPSSGGEVLQPTWCIVICGRYIQDVLQSLKLGQGSRAQTYQTYKDHTAIKSDIIKHGGSKQSKWNYSISH